MNGLSTIATPPAFVPHRDMDQAIAHLKPDIKIKIQDALQVSIPVHTPRGLIPIATATCQWPVAAWLSGPGRPERALSAGCLSPQMVPVVPPVCGAQCHLGSKLAAFNGDQPCRTRALRERGGSGAPLSCVGLRSHRWQGPLSRPEAQDSWS